jgi:energy-converting hydrogenase B subunit D
MGGGKVTWILEAFLLLFVVGVAIAALESPCLLTSSIVLGAYSFMMCLIYAALGAVDVAFTEAAVGAGAGTVFFLSTILRTTRKTSR